MNNMSYVEDRIANATKGESIIQEQKEKLILILLKENKKATYEQVEKVVDDLVDGLWDKISEFINSCYSFLSNSL